MSGDAAVAAGVGGAAVGVAVGASAASAAHTHSHNRAAAPHTEQYLVEAAAAKAPYGIAGGEYNEESQRWFSALAPTKGWARLSGTIYMSTHSPQAYTSVVLTRISAYTF